MRKHFFYVVRDFDQRIRLNVRIVSDKYISNIRNCCISSNFGLMVAEARLERTTSRLWAWRATNCSTPRYYHKNYEKILKCGCKGTAFIWNCQIFLRIFWRCVRFFLFLVNNSPTYLLSLFIFSNFAHRYINVLNNKTAKRQNNKTTFIWFEVFGFRLVRLTPWETSIRKANQPTTIVIYAC